VAKTKLPKTVAGVPIPAAIRNSSTVDTMLNSKIGREILADAVVAGAAAIAAALVKNRPSADQIAKAGEQVAEAGKSGAAATRDGVQDAASALAGVMTAAARAILPASVTGADGAAKSKRKSPGKARSAAKKRAKPAGAKAKAKKPASRETRTV